MKKKLVICLAIVFSTAANVTSMAASISGTITPSVWQGPWGPANFGIIADTSNIIDGQSRSITISGVIGTLPQNSNYWLEIGLVPKSVYDNPDYGFLPYIFNKGVLSYTEYNGANFEVGLLKVESDPDAIYVYPVSNDGSISFSFTLSPSGSAGGSSTMIVDGTAATKGTSTALVYPQDLTESYLVGMVWVDSGNLDQVTVSAELLSPPDEVWVDDDYCVTCANDGHIWGYDAFDNIQDGIDGVAEGGTVHVGPGTYNENQITINKALTINGAGSSSTIIDGGGATLTTTGLVRIIADGNVTFTGFTVRNAGGTSNGGDYGDDKTNVGIYAQSGSAGGTYLISGNKILGTNNPDDWEDYGFYSNSGKENLILTHNEVTQTSGNPVLIEKHPGATEISYNTLDAGCYGIDSIFYMTYDGADITTLQKVSHNTIDIGTGTKVDADRATAISFMSSYSGSGPLGDGKYTNIEISYNTISNLGINRRGISLYNDAYGDGTGGEISNSTIKGNIINGITGSSPNFGVRLAGFITNTTITYNQIIDCDMSFLGTDGRNCSDVYPTGTLINYNNFENNASGLVWEGTTVLNAEYNWWGDESGPLDPNGANETDGKNCYNPSTMKNADGAGDDVTDLTVDYCPWLPPLDTDYDGDGILDNEDVINGHRRNLRNHCTS